MIYSVAMKKLMLPLIVCSKLVDDRSVIHPQFPNNKMSQSPEWPFSKTQTYITHMETEGYCDKLFSCFEYILKHHREVEQKENTTALEICNEMLERINLPRRTDNFAV